MATPKIASQRYYILIFCMAEAATLPALHCQNTSSSFFLCTVVMWHEPKWNWTSWFWKVRQCYNAWIMSLPAKSARTHKGLNRLIETANGTSYKAIPTKKGARSTRPAWLACRSSLCIVNITHRRERERGCANTSSGRRGTANRFLPMTKLIDNDDPLPTTPHYNTAIDECKLLLNRAAAHAA